MELLIARILILYYSWIPSIIFPSYPASFGPRPHHPCNSAHYQTLRNRSVGIAIQRLSVFGMLALHPDMALGDSGFCEGVRMLGADFIALETNDTLDDEIFGMVWRPCPISMMIGI